MKNFVAEFKAFAVRGNVIDLAVAVVIGTAFGKIVSSLVENIVTPLIGILLGGIDFTAWAFVMGEGEEAVKLSYGVFLQSIFDFTIIALAIFLAVKVLSKLQKKEEEKPKGPTPTPEDVVLLREIRDSLRNRN